MANRGRTQLRAPYDTSDDYPPPQPQRQTFRQPDYSNSRFGSPRVADNQLVRASPSRGPSRLDLLEERLSQQEKNTQGLVERAFRTKEDVIESLNFTHGTWQEEKHARNMLQEHIRTITAVVNRLNNDIAVSMLSLTLLHSERPKLYTILAFPSATGLSACMIHLHG